MMKLGFYCYSTTNLGDEIQSIAALQFAPKTEVPIFINRDFPDYKSNDQLFLIANGWFSESYLSFFMPENIHPFFISIHIHQEMELTAAIIKTLKKAEPVGCRDLYTLERLTKAGVDCFFSGCLTLTLGRSFHHKGGGGNLVNDVPEVILAQHFPMDLETKSISQHLERLPLTSIHHRQSQRIINQRRKNQLEAPTFLTFQEKAARLFFNFPLVSQQDRIRFSKATQLLQTYETADLIITSRLHCAIPAIAMGTPVFFAPKTRSDFRFSGYEFLKYCQNINFDISDWAKALSDILERAVETRENPLRNHHGRKLIETLSKSQQR